MKIFFLNQEGQQTIKSTEGFEEKLSTLLHYSLRRIMGNSLSRDTPSWEIKKLLADREVPKEETI